MHTFIHIFYIFYLALDAIAESEDDHFINFSDSLSVLLSLENKKMDNPLVVNLLHKLHLLSTGHKTIFFCWIPSHIGIRGNEAADVAAKESLDFNITASQVPYTDLKPLLLQTSGKSAGRLVQIINFLKLSPPLLCGHLGLEILVRRKLFYLD